MTRERALEIAKSGDFSGCEIYELEEVIRLTGSRLAVAELRRRHHRYGTFMRDKCGAITATP